MFFRLHRPVNSEPVPVVLTLPSGQVRLHLVSNPRARRYILRLQPDLSARLTIPRGGSRAEALRFAERCRPWIDRQLLRQASRPIAPVAWTLGTEILFRGMPCRFELSSRGAPWIQLGSEVFQAANPSGDLRPDAERFLRRLAGTELVSRAAELATVGQFTLRRVTVRNQRSRWGSCSRRGSLSLNWRLVQTPPFVSDYIIFHELAHLKEMNHSARFWAEVRRLCPDYLRAECWLKAHSALLR